MTFPEDFPYTAELEEADASSKRNFKNLLAAHAWVEHANKLGESVLTRKSKADAYARLLQVADQITEAAAHFVACRKGCSHCCNISVVITEFEAKKLAKVSGRKPARVRKTAQRDTLVKKHFGVPCPFLKDNLCSIYEHRPFACRTHVNLSDTAFFCNTAIKPEWSFVPSLNLQGIGMAYGWLFRTETAADIRDFFPPEGKTSAP